MAIYTIHLPPITDERERLLRAIVLRDGFSKSAFVFGPLWLAAKRLWISAILYAASLIGAVSACLTFDLPGTVLGLVLALAALLLGLEGVSLQRWRLARRGWTEAGPVSAASQSEAERRYFEQVGRTVQSPATIKPGEAASARPSDRSVLGLFPEPGARG
jgi:hypothetical protein